MFQLPPLEMLLFLAIVMVSIVSGIFGCIQISRDEAKLKLLLIAFAAAQMILGAAFLLLRAIAADHFPMTDIFESMLALMVLIGMTFIFLSVFMRQVWFLSVMVWTLFIITLLAATVAKPASVLHEAARTPRAVVHAVSMALAGTMIVFAAAMSVLFLWSRMRLKNKQLLKLFGKMPTIQRLESLNLLALRLSFILLTFGLISGVGLMFVASYDLGMTAGDWLTDSKIVLIGLSWILLLLVLILRRMLSFSGKVMAQATLLLCFLILFAFVGSEIFCKSDHGFSDTPEAKVSYSSRH
jgi:ABC-type uncharacterized transport system permease subunit